MATTITRQMAIPLSPGTLRRTPPVWTPQHSEKCLEILSSAVAHNADFRSFNTIFGMPMVSTSSALLFYSEDRSELGGVVTSATPGESVRAVRSQLRLSQHELARLSGMSQPAVARVESDAVSPTFRTISRLLRPMGETAVIGLVPDEAALADACLALDRDLWRGWDGFWYRAQYVQRVLRQIEAR